MLSRIRSQKKHRLSWRWQDMNLNAKKPSYYEILVLF
ncbi:hypothetical protein Gotur_035371, partial [Gossypium turneri]